MDKIIRVLAERDGITVEKAIERYEDDLQEVVNLVGMGMYDNAEFIMNTHLRLEIDYILMLF